MRRGAGLAKTVRDCRQSVRNVPVSVSHSLVNKKDREEQKTNGDKCAMPFDIHARRNRLCGLRHARWINWIRRHVLGLARCCRQLPRRARGESEQRKVRRRLLIFVGSEGAFFRHARRCEYSQPAAAAPHGVGELGTLGLALYTSLISTVAVYT